MTDLLSSELARQANASAAMVRFVARVEQVNPTAGAMVGFLARVYGRYSRHRGPVLSGGVAFFATLSLVPALITLGAFGSVFVDPAELADGFRDLFADQPELQAAIEPVLNDISQMGQVTWESIGVRSLITVSVLLYAASRFVYVVRQVLDTAFELAPHPPSLISRGVAIVVTLAIQLTIAVVLIALGFLPEFLDELAIGDEISGAIRALRLPIGLVLSYGALTAVMRYGVGRRRLVGWRNLGAGVGALIIVLGTVGLGWYLSASNTYATIIAALGTVIVLQIWLFVVGTAIVLAAEVEGVRLGLRRTYHPPPDPTGSSQG